METYGFLRVVYYETAEKEVQDTSYRGSGGVPQLIKKSPMIGGHRGLLGLFRQSIFIHTFRNLDYLSLNSRGDLWIFTCCLL